MKIRQDFPYEHCETCPDCILSVDKKTLYGDDNIVTVELTVTCEHEMLCRQLAERLVRHNEQKSL